MVRASRLDEPSRLTQDAPKDHRIHLTTVEVISESFRVILCLPAVTQAFLGTHKILAVVAFDFSSILCGDSRHAEVPCARGVVFENSISGSRIDEWIDVWSWYMVQTRHSIPSHMSTEALQRVPMFRCGMPFCDGACVPANHQQSREDP